MKLNFHHAKFSVGEYSEAGLARTDVEDKTPFAAEIQENILPSLIGKGQFRPGTEYLSSTNSGDQARLIPFVREIEDAAILELTAGKLRVMHEDAFISRDDVATTITNGEFNSASGWTLSASSGASSTVAGGNLVMHANGQGSEAYAEQQITIDVGDLNKEHGIRIVVERGPVRFRIGTQSGYQDAIGEQILYTGTHSISFTPTSAYGLTYYLRFATRFERICTVASCTIEPEGYFELDAPWAETDLREIAYDQQADIMVLAHDRWQPRQIERRGTRSWSLILFETDGGPVSRVVNGSRVKLSGNRNNVTLTCDEDFFTAGMVGAVVRIYYDSLDANYVLSGNDEWTDTFILRGINGKYANDRKFTYAITGSWSGTINIQRSISGEGGEYLDFNRNEGSTATDITSNLSNTHLGNEEDNNVLAYHRIGFKEDNYTSGTASIRITAQGQSDYGWGRITDFHGPRSVGIEVIDKFINTHWTDAWDIGSWGTFVPWPSSVCFSDNRLFLAGRDRVWASKLNNFNDFNDLDTTVLSTFTRTLGSGGNSSSAKWMLPLQRLIVGTEGSSVSIRSGEFDDTLTTSNVTMRDCSTVGANYVSPVKIDSRGMFVHQSGSDVYVLKPGSSDYEAERTTVYNEEICKAGIIELAAQREPQTLVWAPRADGECPVLMYEHDGDKDVKCWTRFVTSGDVESVCVIPGVQEDRVYMVVNRTIADDIAPETGAEELAPNSGDAFAIDFRDMSAYVVDAATPGNNINEAGSIGDYGVLEGPDSLFVGATNAKMVRQENGFLAYQPHNLAPNHADFNDPGYALVNLTPIDEGLILAPDGVSTVQKIRFTDTGGAVRRWVELPISIPDSVIGQEIEVSFYWYYQGTAARYPAIEISDAGVTNQTGDYAHLDYDLNSVGTEFECYCEQVGTTYSFKGVTGNAFTDRYPVEDIGNSWYRIRAVFIATSAQCAVHIGVEGTWSSSVYAIRPWGLQVNLCPTAQSQLSQSTPLLQNTTGAPLYMLPYAWDADGEAQGILCETASQNRLTSSENFEDAGYVLEGLLAQRTGTDTGPTLAYTATQIQEDGTGVQRHGLYQVVTGANGQYAASLFMKRSQIGWIALRLEDYVGNSYLASFNTTTLEVDLESNDGLTNVAAGVEEYAGGICRIWITAELDPAPPVAMLSSGSSTVTWSKQLPSDVAFSGSSTATWGSQDATPVGAFGSTASASASFVDITTYPQQPLFTNLSFGDNPPFSSGGASSSHLPVPGWETDETLAVTLYGDISNGLRSIYGRCWISGYQDYSQFWQTGDLILAGVSAADIDAGNVQFSLLGWFGRSSTSTAYDCAVKVDYLDAADAIVSSPLDTGLFLPVTPDVWETREVSRMTIPATTRKIRIWIQVYSSFSGCAGFKYELISNNNPADISLFENPSFEEGIVWLRTANSGQQQTTPPDYWTLDSGNMFTVAGDDIGIAAHDNPSEDGYKFIQGGVGSTQVSQTVDLLSRYSGMVTGADIDAGLMLVDFSIWQANTFASDTGRAHLEALDSGLSVISTLYDSGTTEITPLNTWQEKAASEIVVPANTRYIRLTLNMNLVAGTVANALFDDITATLYFAPTNELYADGAATTSFVSIPPGAIEPAGEAVVTFDASADVLTTWSSTGSSSASFVNNDGVLASTSSSAATWDVSNIPIEAAFSMPGSAAGTTFSNADARVSDWSSAGSASAALVSDVRVGGAKLSVFLVDSSEPVLDSTNAPVYAQLNSYTGIITGAQLEYGRSRPSSYMPTQAGGSRAADANYFNLSRIPYDNTAVTMFSEIENLGAGPAEILALATGDSYHSHELDVSNQSVYQIVDTSVSQASITDGVAAQETVVRLASSAVANDARLVVDSGSELTDTSLSMPDLSGGVVRVGSGFDGYIRRIMVLPQSSTESELQDTGVVVVPLTLRYIEKLSLRSEAVGGTVNKMADSGVYFAGPVSSVTCSWLAERTDLVAWATSASGGVTALTGLSADVSGLIDLGGTYTDIWIGIGYRGRFKSGKLAHANQGGSSLTMPKKVSSLGLLLENTHRDAVRFGEDFERMRNMNRIIRGRRQADTQVYASFDDQAFSLPGSWDTDSRLCIEVNAPYPATFLGMVIGTEWNERGLGTK